MNKKKRLTKAEKEYKDLCQNIDELKQNEGMLKKSENELESFLKEKSKAMQNLEKDKKNRKKDYLKSQAEHHGLRIQKENQITETQGIISMSKNLDTHLNKLHSEIQRQQELLYNADYQIQLLERKVARSLGEKTLEETDFWKEVIREKEEETSKVRQKYQATVSALKTLEDEERIVEKKLKGLVNDQKKYQTELDKINLENDMTREQLGSLEGNKKDLMVKNDSMKLEISKLRNRVLEENEKILQLENR